MEDLVFGAEIERQGMYANKDARRLVGFSV